MTIFRLTQLRFGREIIHKEDNLEIVGKYDKLSVAIEGSAESLRELSRAIQCASGNAKQSLLLPPTKLGPCLGYATSLRIAVCEGNVGVSRVGHEIIISGSAEKLAILSRNIGRLAERKGTEPSDGYQDHLHVEYHPGHFYLKESSRPLVVTRRTAIVR